MLDKTSGAFIQRRKGLTTSLPTDLVALEIRSALMYLGELTGEITTDDFVGEYF
jgi:tRNA modification GTPase